MQGKRDEYGLTPKQRKFSENVVSGMTLSDAYRNAYDADGMTNAQIHREASLLGSDPRVAQCMEALGAALRRQSEALTVSDRDKVVTKLRDWLDGKESATSAQLRAAELLGKACGLYKDVVEDHRERPAQAVAAELEAKLATLLQASVHPQPVQQVPQVEQVPTGSDQPTVSH